MAALNGCYSCLKFFVFLVNFVLWLCGIGVVGVSLWLLFDPNLYLQVMTDQRSDYYLGAYIILGVGSFVTIMGFLGCCGSWKESAWMLGTFFAFLMVMLFGEVVAGLLIYFKEPADMIDSRVEKWVRATVEEKYLDNDTNTQETFDLIQEYLECCGAAGPSDWARSRYNRYHFSGQEIGAITHQGGSFNIPRSCCWNAESQECRQTVRDATLNSKGIVENTNIFHEGCAPKLSNFLHENVIYLIAIGLMILLLEIFGMACSLCLCCALKRIDDLKA